MVWVAVGYVRGSQNAVCGFCMCIWGGVAKWPAEKVRKCDERMGRKNASGRRWQRGEGKRKGKRYWEKKKASTREVWAVLDFFLQRVDYFESVPFVDNSFLDTLTGNRLEECSFMKFGWEICSRDLSSSSFECFKDKGWDVLTRRSVHDGVHGNALARRPLNFGMRITSGAPPIYR